MKAKAAARFNGRQGGRFAEEGAGRLLHELHRSRLAELRKGQPSEPGANDGGKWPLRSLREWDAIASVARAREDGISPSPLEATALEIVAVAREEGWKW